MGHLADGANPAPVGDVDAVAVEEDTDPSAVTNPEDSDDLAAVGDPADGIPKDVDDICFPSAVTDADAVVVEGDGDPTDDGFPTKGTVTRRRLVNCRVYMPNLRKTPVLKSQSSNGYQTLDQS